MAYELIFKSTLFAELLQVLEVINNHEKNSILAFKAVAVLRKGNDPFLESMLKALYSIQG